MITFNNTKTIRDLVENAGREYENRVFIRYERDEAIYEKGYGTLSKDTMAIAAYMDAQNEKLGHRVHAAILGTCSYEYLTVLLGVPCAGGIAIPVDVQLPIEIMVRNLEKADTDILFYDREYSSQAELIKELCPFIKRFVCLQTRKNVRCVPMIHRVYRGESFKTLAKPSDCAMIIFTSGTTGNGKGVMLSHANVIDNMFCTDDDTEVCLNVLPINHIFCISGDVMLVLRYGSTLCICDDVSKVLYYIQLFQPTMMRLVPMMAKMFVNRVAMLQQKHPEVPLKEHKEQILGKRLYRLTSGGGYLSEVLSTQLENLGITTGQGYGMSECSPKISVPVFERKDKAASVGRVVTGCQVRIVDGEIQVKSPSVMMGYYNDPELTKEAITEDGWLCTGDLGYVDDEEFLFLSGRKKNLIILSNGENVSPEMIENKFDEDRLVSDILAYGQGDRIAAEIYPNFEYAQTCGITDIQAAVEKIVASHNESLPSYAQIASFSIRNNPFPKTSSRKIQRQKFFEEKENRENMRLASRKPETELQKQVFELAAREIGHTDFGIEDDLYSIGLDSMGSTMLITDVADELERNITLSELMECKTILAICELMEQKDNAPKVDYSLREWYPLSSIQKYFAYVIPGNTTGNLPFAFALSKEIDLERLRAAIHAVLDAHPGLKGIIKPTENKYYGFYRYDDRVIDIPISEIKDEDVPAMVQSLIVPFKYREDDNLVHISLFSGQEHNYMFLDVAHLIGDGMTMNVLMEDIDKAYAGGELEKEKFSYFERTLDEEASFTNGQRAREIEYTAGLMENVRLSRSILNKAEKEDLSVGHYDVIKKRFDSVARKNILYYGKENGVSENAIFLAAFNYCISLFSDEDDVFNSSIHSGRTDSRYARCAGPFFRTYYCRYTKVAHEKVDEFIRKTGNQVMQTMRSELSSPREGEMFFQFQGDILNRDSVGGMKAERIRAQLDALPFHLQVMYDDEGYYTEMRFWKNRFDKEMIEIFLTCMEAVLKAVITESSVRCLKYHLPKEVYPLHFGIEAARLREAVGKDIIPGTDDDENIKVYIFDESYKKKPYGAWGPLYIMNYEPVDYVDAVQYPYGPGALYNTGLIARIMPDGSIDMLENAGRLVCTEGVRGRMYYDLKKAESLLTAIDGIEKASCYLEFDSEMNEMTLASDIKTAKDMDAEAIKQKLTDAGETLLVPKTIKFCQ